MAMQAGMGFSKILILVGAGYTGSILLTKGRLSDLLGELQDLVKGLEKARDPSNADSEYSDAIASQVRRLAMEVRQLASSRQITVLNGNSSQIGNMTSFAMPAVAIGALGYGYMWWKGLSFSNFMYVTKSHMANAVSSMTNHLEQLTNALAAAKRHLTQRIENLDGKLDDQKEMSKSIKNEVSEVRANLGQINYDLVSLQDMIRGLDGKIVTLEDKQDIANAGVWYLCQFVGAKDPKMTDFFKALPEPPSRTRGFITQSGTQGLKQIMDSITSDKTGKTDAGMQSGIDRFDSNPRSVTRTASIKGF
ncbi:uncharacterized protein LOC122667684 [Telopea speciosissima]|uniref:uncharacterized protein LOC122667684 n=1 Tax=Telopea speciosissima TaxID=54955 RepID=UPI001CC41E6C|nr:uncharacterized protein LOC122667684 [Telopea speciosissima]